MKRKRENVGKNECESVFQETTDRPDGIRQNNEQGPSNGVRNPWAPVMTHSSACSQIHPPISAIAVNILVALHETASEYLCLCIVPDQSHFPALRVLCMASLRFPHQHICIDSVSRTSFSTLTGHRFSNFCRQIPQ